MKFVGWMFAIMGAIFIFVFLISFITGQGDSGAIITGVVFLIIGLIFFVLGLAIIVFRFVNNKKVQWLLSSGTKISGKVSGFEYLTSISINYQHPWIVIAQGNDLNGNLLTFKSQFLYIDPRTDIKVGDPIDIYIDPSNPKRYFIDVRLNGVITR